MTAQLARPTSYDVQVQPGDLDHWRTLGLGLDGLHNASRLNARTEFEAPMHFGAQLLIWDSLIRIGAFCSIAGGEFGSISVGRYCSIARGSVIGMHEHSFSWFSSSRASYVKNLYNWEAVAGRTSGRTTNYQAYDFKVPGGVTELGNDVFIGNGAFVRRGVKIGDGAIIAARAVVTKDVPPFAIVAGNPGRVIKMRFTDREIERLTKLQWWNYSLFDFPRTDPGNIEMFADTVEEAIASGGLLPYEGTRYALGDLLARRRG